MNQIFKSKKTRNSPRVTLGDPSDYSNKDSAKETNTANRPQVPKNE